MILSSCNDLADLVADLLRLAALDDLVAQARIGGLLLDPARIQIEHGRELLCQRRDVDLVLRQLQRSRKTFSTLDEAASTLPLRS